MSEQPFEHLAYRNRFVKELRQPLDGVDCFQPFVNLNPENNLIVLNLSEAQFLQIYSALLTGADIVYPDESIQVVANFLKGLHCPPNVIPEECFNLPSYANNIGYTPANPYIEPDVIPDGYLMQPFLVNGQNGNDFPGYEPFDVIVPFDAITFDINFFEEIAGQLPTLQIMVQGTGSVNLHFLTSVQGGLVVVTLDYPPNLLDILAGIVTGSENIIDLNQDLVSLPPETAKDLIYPVSLETGGIHTIYAVFLPILDDSLIPVRFGGGFRGLELCGILPEGDMGVQNLRFVSCNLEQQNADGSWSVVDGWEDWLDCIPSGGGGGTAGISVFNKKTGLTGNQAITSTSYVGINPSEADFDFTPSRANMLVICDNVRITGSGASVVTRTRIVVDGVAGNDINDASQTGTATGEVQTSDWFSGLTVGVQVNIALQFRVNSGTGTIGSTTSLNWTIIEFDDASELFVEDIRIQGRELQKKIGGAWIVVTDSLATILNQIEAIATNAAAAAANAQNTANNAQTIASGAVTVNNAQNIQLASIGVTLNDHEARIEALEAAVAQGTWDGYPLGQVTDTGLNPAGGRYSGVFTNYDNSPASTGWIPNTNFETDIIVQNAMRLGGCVFVRVGINVLSTPVGNFWASINGEAEVQIQQWSNGSWAAWIPVHPNGQDDMTVQVRNDGNYSGWRLNSMVYLFVNVDPFTMMPL